MGNSQSPRQVTISNPNDTIVLTTDVQRRLIGKDYEGPDQGVAVISNEDVEEIKQRIEAEYMQKITETNHKIRMHEFAKAVQEVESKFLKQSGSPVCQDLQQEVYECYQSNLRQPLNCSRQVQAFTEEVERARRNALMSRSSS